MGNLGEFFSSGLLEFFNYSAFANIEWGHIIMIIIGFFISIGILKSTNPFYLSQ